MRSTRSLLKGSVEDKLAQIERLLLKMKRSRDSYVVGVIPPIPVFDYVKRPDETGVVFHKIMPANGTITIGCMWVGEFDKKQSPQAVLTSDNRLGGGHVKIPIQGQNIVVQPNMPVDFGQRLTLSITPSDSCSDIWTAFLFEVDKKHAQQSHQLTSGFLRLIEKSDEEFENA